MGLAEPQSKKCPFLGDNERDFLAKASNFLKGREGAASALLAAATSAVCVHLETMAVSSICWAHSATQCLSAHCREIKMSVYIRRMPSTAQCRHLFSENGGAESNNGWTLSFLLGVKRKNSTAH